MYSTVSGHRPQSIEGDMAMSESTHHGAAHPHGEFLSFLEAVTAVIPAWSTSVTALLGESDRIHVMNVYADTFAETWNGSAEELTRIYRGLGVEAQRKMDHLVRASGMLMFIQRTTALIEKGELVSPEARLSVGSIFEKIKQFIMCILDCLGIDLPCIIVCLFQLLDNLIDNFVGIVSPDSANYLFTLEERASKVRQFRAKERKIASGCACGA